MENLSYYSRPYLSTPSVYLSLTLSLSVHPEYVSKACMIFAWSEEHFGHF